LFVLDGVDDDAEQDNKENSINPSSSSSIST
jgi:hypothetical protein